MPQSVAHVRSPCAEQNDPLFEIVKVARSVRLALGLDVAAPQEAHLDHLPRGTVRVFSPLLLSKMTRNFTSCVILSF